MLRHFPFTSSNCHLGAKVSTQLHRTIPVDGQRGFNAACSRCSRLTCSRKAVRNLECCSWNSRISKPKALAWGAGLSGARGFSGCWGSGGFLRWAHHRFCATIGPFTSCSTSRDLHSCFPLLTLPSRFAGGARFPRGQASWIDGNDKIPRQNPRQSFLFAIPLVTGRPPCDVWPS
jgi:hypothetical protein